MTLDTFLTKLTTSPNDIAFTETMAIIDATYIFTPTQFSNGNTVNQAGENNGSCKIFAFGLKQGLSESQTLACFGAYYRDDVLAHPQGDDHQNIRHFMRSGWAGIDFENDALSIK